MSRKLTNPNPAHPHNRKVAFLQTCKEQFRKLTTDILRKCVDAEISKKVGHVCMLEAIQWNNKPLEFRHQFMEFLLCASEINFKQQWKDNYGWDFDDCYDDIKLRAHIAGIQNKAKVTKKPEAEVAALAEIRKAIGIPDGCEAHEVELTDWIKYDKEVGYEKHWAVVELKDGTIDKTWYWPNAGFFGPHAEENVLSVMYCRELERMKGISAAIIGRDGISMSREQFDTLSAEDQEWCRANLNQRIKDIIDSGYAGTLPDGRIVDRRIFPVATPCKKNELLATPVPKDV